ncbi:MAG: transketolase [Rhizobiaceae bacterium]
MSSRENHDRMANAIRALTMDAVEKAKSGHPGMPMGMADVATVLFSRYLKFDPKAPFWPDRDRFILSAGHGSMLLYALLYLTGYEDMTIDQIKRFRQLGSKTAGHPEVYDAAGIETTTGPLGQGIATSVGFALAERILNAHYGDAIVNHHTYVMASDGDLMEGVSHEAISLAGHLCLNRLIVFYDDNSISIDGKTEITETGDQVKRFEAAGWNAFRIDGHDPDAIAKAIETAQKSDRPTMIACRTIIGFGLPTRQGTQKAHSDAPGEEEIAGARKELHWDSPPFVIPDDVMKPWREAGRRCVVEREAWQKRFDGLDQATRDEFDRRLARETPEGFDQAVRAEKKKLAADKPKVATRKASEMALEVVNAAIPETIGGAADLTPSVNTRTKDMRDIVPGDYSGRYVRYGIREHGMAAAMNGLALHGGILPYGGTFFTFSDYCRPALRLSALMHNRVIYVFTHDSIGLGEDGPTHQPVEHLAAVRAMPNLQVIRPADAIETLEAWQIAVESPHAPTALILSRQPLPPVRFDGDSDNRVRQGAYELAAAEGKAEVTIFSTGSEVQIALDAKARLDAAGHPTRVVSVPSFDLFEAQPDAYKAEVIGDAPVKVAVEAAVRLGWDRFIGPDGVFVGMSSFGASAPIADLYPHFGITADVLVEKIEGKLGAK